jgi:hypothetical protein
MTCVADPDPVGRIGIILADPDRHLGPADPDPYYFN